MRWLLDQGLPRTTASLLRAQGEDAVHTAEIQLSTSPDEEILKAAASENRIIVTLDADFHRHLVLNQSSQPSVVRLREEGLKAADIVAILNKLMASFEASLTHGCVISYQRNKVRLRALPLK